MLWHHSRSNCGWCERLGTTYHVGEGKDRACHSYQLKINTYVSVVGLIC